MIKEGDMLYAWADKDNVSREGVSYGGAVTALLRYALQSGMVDAVFTLKKGMNSLDPIPVLVKDPEELGETAGTFYTGHQLLAKDIKNFLEGAKAFKLAVVVKSCDAKSIVELAKRGQLNLDNILMVGLNCHGTMPAGKASEMAATLKRMPVFRRNEAATDTLGIGSRRMANPACLLQQAGLPAELAAELNERYGSSVSEDALDTHLLSDHRRDNCLRCGDKIPRQADVACGYWGVVGPRYGRATFVEVVSDKGASLVQGARDAGFLNTEAAPDEGIALRAAAETEMIRQAEQHQRDQFAVLGRDGDRLAWLQRETSRCLRCYACIDACPICYCKDCLLKQSVVTKPGQVPPGLLFHLVRFMHVADSCVNCGQCEDLCPAEIPLARIMHSLQIALQSETGYKPGQDLTPPPLNTIAQSR